MHEDNGIKNEKKASQMRFNSSLQHLRVAGEQMET